MVRRPFHKAALFFTKESGSLALVKKVCVELCSSALSAKMNRGKITGSI